jgi:Ca2+-binding RTX toxin-like protein
MNGRGRILAVAAAMTMVMAQQAHAVTRVHLDGDVLVVAAAGHGATNVVAVTRPHVSSDSVVVSDAGATVKAGPGCIGAPFANAAVCSLGVYEGSLSFDLGDGGDVLLVRGAFCDTTVDAGAGDDRIDVPGPGPVCGDGSRIDLGDGDDTLRLEGMEDTVQVFGGDGDDDIDASGQEEGGRYYGGAGNDRIAAGGWVYGGDGADTLDGRSLATANLFGEAGDDVLDMDDGEPDHADCGAGTDAVRFDFQDTVTGCETVG